MIMSKQAPTRKIFRYLLAGSLIFYIFSGVSSVLNYTFYPVIARLVSVVEYGEIQFLTSMYNQLAIGFVVLNILAIIISVKLTAKSEQSIALAALNHIGTYLVGSITIIGAFILYLNHTALQFNNTPAIIALALSILISVPYTTAIGQLQGDGRFIASGVINVIASFAKLVFATLFIIWGWGVAGAIAGIGAGVLLAYIISAILNKDFGFKRSMSACLSVSKLSFVRKQAIAALAAMTALTLLSTADSIVSRIVLNPHDAGVYAVVATITKIILTVTSPIMWLALPAATAKNRALVMRYIKLTAIISLVITCVMLINPLFIADFLLGNTPSQFLNIIPYVFISMASYGVAYIAVAVNLCYGNLKSILWVISGGLAMFAITIACVTPSLGLLYATVVAQLVAGVCIAIGGTITVLRYERVVKR